MSHTSPASKRFQRNVLALLLLVAGCSSEPVTKETTLVEQSETRNSTPVRSVAAEMKRTRRLLDQGDVAQARKVATELRNRNPQDPKVVMLAAETCAASQDFVTAISILESLRESDESQSVQARMQIAGYLAEIGDWEDAKREAANTVEAFPGNAAALHAYALMLNQRGYRFQANEQIRRLIQAGEASIDELRCVMAPERSYYPFVNKPDFKSPEVLDKAGLLNVARVLMTEGDVRDALETLDSSESLKQGDPAVVALHGQLLLATQQYELLDRWVVTASQECQRYPSYWMGLGGWALQHQDYDLAVRAFAEVVLREPAIVAAYDQLSVALRSAGHPSLADEVGTRAVEAEQALELARKVLDNSQASQSDVDRLSQALVDLGRPLEGYGWAKLGGMRFGKATADLRKIENARRRTGRTFTPDFRQQTLLCGLDLNLFPLPNSERLGSGGSSANPSVKSIEVTTPPRFVEIAADVGLKFQYLNADPPLLRAFRIYEAYGAGVAAIDYDLNGRVDFYVGQGAATHANALFRNEKKRFANVTAMSATDDRGYTFGVTSGDLNQDGFPDLIVGNMEANQIFLNQGDGTFVSQDVVGLWQQPLFTTSVAIADVNSDHLPDIVEVNYLDDPDIHSPVETNDAGLILNPPRPLQFQPAGDRVFLSSADQSWRGIALGNEGQSKRATGLGVLVTDLDDRLGNEIFVANDLMANQLWKFSEQEFLDVALLQGVAFGSRGAALGCMGIAAADFDRNGFLDLHITNFDRQWSNLYMQNAQRTFVDLPLPYGLDVDTYAMVGFGTESLDYNNDSAIDLAICNGHIEDLIHKGAHFQMPTQLFAGTLTQFVKQDVDGDEYWDNLHMGRGLITCDWNRDGWLDLVVTDLHEPLVLLENQSANGNHWLQLQLVGTKAERDAIGARVEISWTDSNGLQKQMQTVQTGDGYLSKNEALVSFGLGAATTINRLVVRWPDGSKQEWLQISADKRLLIIQGEQTFFPQL